MKRTLTTVFTAALLAACGAALADADFRITEAYVGITGEDGTPDWIEVTNFGTMDGDTGLLWYDDESLSVAAGVQLPSFILSPGESAVFLVTGDVTATSIDDFIAIWGPVPNLGAAAGGGGLSQGGDVAGILLGDGTVVDTLAFPALPVDSVATIVDPTGMGSLALAQDGVLGAYTSNPFFNDNLADAIANGNLISLVGSPGVVPEPAAAVLVALAAGLVAPRRRG